MTNEEEDFDLEINEEELANHKPLDLNVVKEKIPTYTSEKLCEMIVCDRYFGCYREIARMCMEELSNRRIAGSDFDFENHIEKELATLPKLEALFKVPDLSDVMRQFAKKVVR